MFIFSTDINLIVTSWDEKLYAVTGLSASEICGRSLLEQFPDLVQRGIAAIFQRVINTGIKETLAPPIYPYLIRCEVQNPSAYFEEMQQRVIINPLHEDHQLVGSIVTIEDITGDLERKLSQKEELTLHEDDLPLTENLSTLMLKLADENWQVRQKAIHRLSQFSQPEITAQLIYLLQNQHRNPSLLNAVLQTLTNSKVDPVPALITCLQSEDTDLRIYAALALGDRQDPKAISSLLQALDDPDDNVRYHVIDALVKLNASAAVDKLIKIVESEDFYLAFPALEALLELDESAITPNLVPLLENTINWRLRREAVDRLTMETDPQLMTDLVGLLRRYHRNPSILNSVIQVLVLSHLDPLPLLLQCLHDPDPQLRTYTALTLGERKDPRAIPYLRELLMDEDTNVCYHAIEALGHLKAKTTVEDLLEIALADDFFLAFPALNALIKIGDNSILTKLVPLLDHDLLIGEVIQLFAVLGDDSIIVPLASKLNNPTAPVREIVQAIWQIYQRYQQQGREGGYILDLTRSQIKADGVNHLLQALSSASESELPAFILLMGLLSGRQVEIALAGLLSNHSVRASVIDALVSFGPRVIDLLIANLDDPKVEVRQASVIALGRIGSPLAVPSLLNMLNDEPDLIMKATEALAKIGDRRAQDGLMTLLNHPQGSVRLGAIAALNSLAPPNLATEIKPLLSSNDPLLQESALKIAGYFAWSNCLDELFALTHDPHEQVRRTALEHLPYLDHPQVLPILLEALVSETPTLRATAARAIGVLEEQTAWPFLLEALKDQDNWVRYQAARSLESCCPFPLREEESVLQQLQDFIEEEDSPFVKAALIKTFGYLGSKGKLITTMVIPCLTHYSHDLQPDIARAALMSLANIHHNSAIVPLLQALNSPVSQQRLNGILALREKGSDSAAIQAIISLQWIAASDPEAEIALAAMESLAHLSKNKSSEVASLAYSSLLELTIDPRQREFCLHALLKVHFTSKSPQNDYIHLLASGLNHQNEQVRGTVVELLKRLKNPTASQYLLSALNDQESNVRLAAVNALTYLGNLGAQVQLSILARNDPSPMVRRAAQKFLLFS